MTQEEVSQGISDIIESLDTLRNEAGEQVSGLILLRQAIDEEQVYYSVNSYGSPQQIINLLHHWLKKMKEYKLELYEVMSDVIVSMIHRNNKMEQMTAEEVINIIANFSQGDIEEIRDFCNNLLDAIEED